MKSKERGVTLIALVVTIVVLLILASIGIGAITSDNGVIKQSNETKQRAERESIIEKIEADLYTEKTKTEKTPSKNDLKELIKEKDFGTVNEDDSFTSKIGNYKIEFSDTFSDTLSTDDGAEQLGKDYQTAIEAFMHDNPELFYIDVNKMLLNIETTTKFLRTTHNVYISPASGKTYLSDDFGNVDQIKLAINQVENIKNNIINSLTGTDYDKIMKIHDYLVDNIDYDSTYQATGTYSIYGALIGKKCVCEGYAKSLKYLANQAGIKCEIMQGTGTNSSGQTESHAWNCVKIDGIWYEIDATWDDPIIIGNGYKANVYKYRYFLKGTVSFEKDHILSYQFSEGGKSFEYPIISKRDY